jgi:predicted acetyltransferase
VKINNIYVGWVEACHDGKRMEFNCFILKKYRSLGYGREILDDLIYKNFGFDIIVKIKKSNYAALQCIKSFPFNIESKSEDGKIIYRLTRNS